ncbi:MAG TPA: ATP-binding cassette domain-containing protein [Fimbriimonadaceae bacterium]|nr:ATP-binding cassette domain-containing protein [Fimbriimonadaceae bacterium]
MSLVLQEVALSKPAAALSMLLEPGHSLCVVGPAASGKSRLLRIIAGLEEPELGFVERPDSVAAPEPCNRRVRPQDLSHRRGANRAQLATEVLSHLGLWDVRQKPIADLAPPQVAACDVVETFLSGAGLLVLDEHLDRLDPWVRVGAMQIVRDRCAHGAIAVVATNQLDLASQFDFLVVLKGGQPVHAGGVRDLVKSRGQRSLVVECERGLGVRAIVDSLLVGVEKSESGYRLTPGPGQEHAARLLRDGYGDVKYVVSDDIGLPEIIRSLVS